MATSSTASRAPAGHGCGGCCLVQWSANVRVPGGLQKSLTFKCRLDQAEDAGLDEAPAAAVDERTTTTMTKTKKKTDKRCASEPPLRRTRAPSKVGRKRRRRNDDDDDTPVNDEQDPVSTVQYE